jgi:hypothetical protein
MQNIDLNILQEVLTIHLLKSKGELYHELLKNNDERERFLSGVKKIILFEKNDKELLSDFLVSYGFVDYFLNIDSIKDEFIESISEHIFLGHTGLETNILLESDKESLDENLVFLSNLKKVYKIQGRKELKEHLLNLEELSKFDLSEDLLKSGVKAQIRNELKARFNDLENSENDHNNKEFFKPEFTIETSERLPNKILPFAKYALAALFIGIISITSVVYNNKQIDNGESFAINKIRGGAKKSEVIINEKSGLVKLDKEQTDLTKNYGFKKSETLNKNHNSLDDSIEKSTEIESINEENIATRGGTIEDDTNQKVYETYNKSVYIHVNYQLDESVINKSFKYIFNSKERKLVIITNLKLIVEEYLELNNGKYIKIQGSYFAIKESNDPIFAKKISKSNLAYLLKKK